MKLVSQAVLAVAIVAAVIGGAVLLVRGTGTEGGIEIHLPTATPVAAVELKVYMTGAVHVPGVYVVGQESRLADAIEAAGGATDEANLTVINLAARVKDEDHWHIPRQGEEVAPLQTSASTASEKIDINSASPEVLEGLPGIGEVKAQAIVAYREANGPYSAVDQLLEIRGIGAVTLDAIRSLVEAR